MLIAAFASRADVLLLDEPTTGLDPLMEQTFRTCVREARDRGQTVLLSSHILSEVEVLCDRVAMLRAGRIIEIGRLDDLRGLLAVRVHAELDGPPPDLSGIAGREQRGRRRQHDRVRRDRLDGGLPARWSRPRRAADDDTGAVVGRAVHVVLREARRRTGRVDAVDRRRRRPSAAFRPDLDRRHGLGARVRWDDRRIRAFVREQLSRRGQSPSAAPRARAATPDLDPARTGDRDRHGRRVHRLQVLRLPHDDRRGLGPPRGDPAAARRGGHGPLAARARRRRRAPSRATRATLAALGAAVGVLFVGHDLDHARWRPGIRMSASGSARPCCTARAS